MILNQKPPADLASSSMHIIWGTINWCRRPSSSFEPKSITYLRAGQFWAIPLSDNRFGCGRALAVPGPSDPAPSLYLNTRIFLAGMMDWSGDEPPPLRRSPDTSCWSNASPM